MTGKTIRIGKGVAQLGKDEKDLLVEFAEKNGMSLYQAANMIVREHCTGNCGKSSTNEDNPFRLPNYEKAREELRERPSSELKKLFMKFVKSGDTSNVMIRNQAFLPDRYLHHLDIMRNKRAPPSETINLVHNDMMTSIIGNILNERGDNIAKVDWEEEHWKAGRAYKTDSHGRPVYMPDPDVRHYTEEEFNSKVFEH